MAIELDDIIGPVRRAEALVAACELNLPAAVADGARTVPDLAGALDVRGDLTRLVRALVLDGALTVSGGELGLTELGRRLIPWAPRSMHWRVRFFAGEVTKPCAHLAQVVRSGEMAWRALGSAGPWEHFADPARREVFSRAMAEVSSETFAVAAHAWPGWASASHVIDVGGGNGAGLATLLDVHPHLRGAVLDTADGLTGSDDMLSTVGDRAEAVTGDFFVSVPARADVYTAKSVLHDWSDAEAEAILSTIAAAMHPESRLGLIEMLLDEPIKPEIIRHDLVMPAASTGRERSSEEYTTLLHQAGLDLEEIVPLPGTPYSLLLARRAS